MWSSTRANWITFLAVRDHQLLGLSPATGNVLTGSKDLENTSKIETCKCCSGEEERGKWAFFFLMPAGALSFMDEEEGGSSW